MAAGKFAPVLETQDQDKSRLASVCAPRVLVSKWLPFVKTARQPRGSRPQVQSLRGEKVGEELSLHSPCTEKTSGIPHTNTLSEDSSDTFDPGTGGWEKVLSEPTHINMCTCETFRAHDH